MTPSSYQLTVPTDHFQFMLGDWTHGPTSDTRRLWEAGNRVATHASCPSVVAIGCSNQDGAVPIVVQLLTAPLALETSDRRVGNFVVAIPSGVIVFWNPEAVGVEGLPVVHVPAGTYLGVVDEPRTLGDPAPLQSHSSTTLRISIWRTSDSVDCRFQYPSLVVFFGTYFNQDFIEDHGSVLGTVRHIGRVEGKAFLRSVLHELDALISSMPSPDEVRKLMSAWDSDLYLERPREELAEIRAMVEGLLAN